MPVLTAVSSSVRHLYTLLRCISFSNHADVQISADGIRFSAEDGGSGAMQGLAFLSSSLFTTYNFTLPPSTTSPSNPTTANSTTNPVPPFQISLPALLETLQILLTPDTTSTRASSAFPDSGLPLSNPNNNSNGGNLAFSHAALGIPQICRFTYAGAGSPLALTLEEGGVSTVCRLVAYSTRGGSGSEESDASDNEYGARGRGGDIPFLRTRLALKTILPAGALYTAVQELGAFNPSTLTLSASSDSDPPSLSLSAEGSLGSASVTFTAASSSTNHSGHTNPHPSTNINTSTSTGTTLLETFVARYTTTQSYKFSHIKSASKAMASASKVSVRSDERGVLSLQFMLDLSESGNGAVAGPGRDGRAGREGRGGVSGQGGGGEKMGFVDFRFVPLLRESEGEDAEMNGESGSE